MFGRMKEGLGSMRRKESPLEGQLKEATSREKWGVPNTTLQAIATATNNMEDCDMVMGFIWKILQEKKDKEWRRIVKTLALIEVILKYGSERAIQDIRRDQWRIQQWKEFRFMEEGKDVGAGIRSKAASILEMLTDEEYLQEEKDKAQKLQQKMTSVGAPGADVKQGGGASAFKSPFDRARRPWRRKHPEESPHSSPSSPVAGRLPQSEADVAAMVQLFMNMTNESRLTAQDWLERHSWNVEEAVFKYMAAKGGPRPGDDRPGMMERKSRAEQFMAIAKVTEKQAEEYLERSGWNVEEALDKYLAEGAKSAPPAPSRPSSKPAAKPRAQSSSSSSGSESYSEESDEEPSKPSAQGGGWPQSGGDAGGWPSSGNASGGGGWPSSNGQKGGDWPDNSGAWGQDPGSKGGGGGWPGGDKGGGKGQGPWGGGAAGPGWGGGGPEWGSGKGALGPAGAGDGKGFGGPPAGKGDPGSGWGGSSMRPPASGYGGGKGFGGAPGGTQKGAGGGNPFGGDSFPPQSQAPRPPGPFGSSSGSKGGFGGSPPGGFGGPPASGGFGSQSGGSGGFGGGKGPQAGNPFGGPPGGQGSGGFGGPPSSGFDKGGSKGGWDAPKGGGGGWDAPKGGGGGWDAPKGGGGWDAPKGGGGWDAPKGGGPGPGGFGSKGGAAGNPFGGASGPGGPGGFGSQGPGGFGGGPGYGKGPAGPFGGGGGGGGGGFGGWPS